MLSKISQVQKDYMFSLMWSPDIKLMERGEGRGDGSK
jgi:hypothetical protein